MYTASLLCEFVRVVCNLLSGESTFYNACMYTASFLCVFVRARYVYNWSMPNKPQCLRVPSHVAIFIKAGLDLLKFFAALRQIPFFSNPNIARHSLSRQLVNFAVKIDVYRKFLTKRQRNNISIFYYLLTPGRA